MDSILLSGVQYVYDQQKKFSPDAKAPTWEQSEEALRKACALCPSFALCLPKIEHTEFADDRYGVSEELDIRGQRAGDSACILKDTVLPQEQM